MFYKKNIVKVIRFLIRAFVFSNFIALITTLVVVSIWSNFIGFNENEGETQSWEDVSSNYNLTDYTDNYQVLIDEDSELGIDFFRSIRKLGFKGRLLSGNDGVTLRDVLEKRLSDVIERMECKVNVAVFDHQTEEMLKLSNTDNPDDKLPGLSMVKVFAHLTMAYKMHKKYPDKSWDEIKEILGEEYVDDLEYMVQWSSNIRTANILCAIAGIDRKDCKKQVICRSALVEVNDFMHHQMRMDNCYWVAWEHWSFNRMPHVISGYSGYLNKLYKRKYNTIIASEVARGLYYALHDREIFSTEEFALDVFEELCHRRFKKGTYIKKALSPFNTEVYEKTGTGLKSGGEISVVRFTDGEGNDVFYSLVVVCRGTNHPYPRVQKISRLVHLGMIFKYGVG